MKIKNILVIDDNAIDNHINKHVLTISNIAEKITVKTSALEALEYLKNKINDFPEVVFLDIQMPIMDGFGFLEQFEKFPKKKKTECSIYMLSSSNNLKDIEKANNNHYILKYLMKPLTQYNFVDLINNRLR